MNHSLVIIFLLSSKQQDFVDYEIESLLGKNSPVICKNVPTIVHVYPLSDAKNSHGKEMLILNLSLGMLTNGSQKQIQEGINSKIKYCN